MYKHKVTTVFNSNDTCITIVSLTLVREHREIGHISETHLRSLPAKADESVSQFNACNTISSGHT